MNFRRQPFQFTSIDPVKRHAELQKRFGLPSDEMYVDNINPEVMGVVKESLMNGSPRLQHRVPVFSQESNASKSTSIQNNIDNGQHPRVRVIPIQVEGLNDPSKRHQTFSSAADCLNQEKHPERSTKPQPTLVNTNKIANHPRVRNIPIKIETNNKIDKESKCKETVIPTVLEQVPKLPNEFDNKCAASGTVKNSTCSSLKQIEDVLNKLKGYEVEVKDFTGTYKDKQYRYLDEMLTRCMLDLDNVDTLGLAEVRQSRKTAVKKVQACIDLLETKVSTLATINTKELVADAGSIITESAMVVDTEVKYSNLTKDNASSCESAKACDIEMYDVSCKEQSAKVEEFVENLTEGRVEKIPSENVELETSVKVTNLKNFKDSPKDRIIIEKMEDNTNRESSEFVIEEVCSEDKKSPVEENSNVNIEITIPQDSCEQLEPNNSAFDEQVFKSCDKPNLCNSFDTSVDKQQITDETTKTGCDTIVQ